MVTSCRLAPVSRVQCPASPISRAMVKIPVVSSVLRVSSLSTGYFENLTWPEEMSERPRKVWCRLLAQAIGPLREHLKDTTCPLVEPGSPAERELQDARHDIEEKRLQLFKLVTRITELEIAVGKRLEELEKVAGAWAASAEESAELEMVFCKQKLENMRNYRMAHKIAARPSTLSHAAAAGQAVEEANVAASVQSSSVAADVHAPRSQTPTRGRDNAPRGSYDRHHSPLMIPVQWGMTENSPTGLLPSEVLHTYSRGSHCCIIRRSTPDAHPEWRLLAPDHEALQEFRPRDAGLRP